MKTKINKNLPDSPGIYMFRNNMGEIIYIGKAISLKKRVASYFRTQSHRDPKTSAMIKQIYDLDFIQLKSEIEALILESKYIKEFKPKFNILMKDDKQYPLIKFTKDIFSCIKIVRNELPDGAIYLGPFTDSKGLKRTKREIEKIFGIRPCSIQAPTRKHAKHCLYHQTGQCSAPCLGKITSKEYTERINEALLVLTGHTKKLLNWLEKKMNRFSLELKYEEAGQLRDIINALKNISGSRVKSIMKYKRPVISYKNEIKIIKEILNLKKTPHIIEAFDISNISGQYATGSMVYFYDGKPNKRYYKHFKIKNVKSIDDYAMMREIVTRHFSHITNEKKSIPELVIIDGGKGHLETARKVLNKLSLDKISVIGLAKKNEEIFIPELSDPIVLDKNIPCLQLFQRIRDEAHRFAISYHKKLRSKKIKESVLYNIPNLGEKKIKLLLKHFGSVKRISNASNKEISKIPGFGIITTNKILSHLNVKT
ncbi:GIY-YIG nuclease family protein [Chlamydiota bacterium]